MSTAAPGSPRPNPFWGWVPTLWMLAAGVCLTGLLVVEIQNRQPNRLLKSICAGALATSTGASMLALVHDLVFRQVADRLGSSAWMLILAGFLSWLVPLPYGLDEKPLLPFACLAGVALPLALLGMFRDQTRDRAQSSMLACFFLVYIGLGISGAAQAIGQPPGASAPAPRQSTSPGT